MKTFWATCAILFFSASAAVAEKETFYVAPSGNIGCVTFEYNSKPNSVTCEIFKANGLHRLCRGEQFRPQFTVEDGGKVKIDCMNLDASEGLEGLKGQLLPYGDAIDLGTVKCGMSSKGIYCRNADGHGFKLAKSSQKVF